MLKSLQKLSNKRKKTKSFMSTERNMQKGTKYGISYKKYQMKERKQKPFMCT